LRGALALPFVVALAGCGGARQPAAPHRPIPAASRYELPTAPAPRELVAAAEGQIRRLGSSIRSVRCDVVEWTDYAPVRAAKQLDCQARTLGACFTWSFGVRRLSLTLESVTPLCSWRGPRPPGSLAP
jgi:hypothetical protein